MGGGYDWGKACHSTTLKLQVNDLVGLFLHYFKGYYTFEKASIILLQAQVQE